MTPRLLSRTLSALAASAAAGLSLLVGASGAVASPPASAASPAPSAAPATTAPAAPTVPGRRVVGEYLSLGDSLAAGYQPAHGDAPAGDDRAGGYVGVVAAGMAARGSKLRVTNLACSGETSQTMVYGGRCRYREGSQLQAARRFLRMHPNTKLITVTVGANDVRACLTADGVDGQCAQRQLKTVSNRLDRVLTDLRRSAPRARVVVLDYYNPYLAARLQGSQGRQLAVASTIVQAQLNSVIRREAADHGARTARIATAYDSHVTRPVDVPGIGRVPLNLARICTWTWMCTKQDIHANDTGYAVMGRAVLARLDDRR